jgi:hypothetical protein
MYGSEFQTKKKLEKLVTKRLQNTNKKRALNFSFFIHFIYLVEPLFQVCFFSPIHEKPIKLLLPKQTRLVSFLK